MAPMTRSSRPSLTLTMQARPARSGGHPPGGATGSVARGQSGETVGAEDATSFALGRAAPHAMVDPVGQGVFEARGLLGAFGADPTGFLDANPVAWEEDRGVHL